MRRYLIFEISTCICLLYLAVGYNFWITTDTVQPTQVKSDHVLRSNVTNTENDNKNSESRIPSYNKRKILSVDTLYRADGLSFGSVTRICPRLLRDNRITRTVDPVTAKYANEKACWLFDPNNATWLDCNQNGVLPLRSRQWMHPALAKYSLLMYHSSHGDRKGQSDIGLLVAESEDSTWNSAQYHDDTTNATFYIWEIGISTAEFGCKSIHSPSVYVDDKNQLMYMYVHGHNCVGGRGQPTLYLISKDGIQWELPPHQRNGLFKPSVDFLHRHFYLTAPVQLEDDFYALVKTQETGVGSMKLLKAANLTGPWDTSAPVLISGPRHYDLHLVTNQWTGKRLFLLFYSVIGDHPEHIVMASIDTAQSTDWRQWAITSGPEKVIQPDYIYENGNAKVKPSVSGGSGCNIMAQLRDPKFLPDSDATNYKKLSHENDSWIISGQLYYVVQGERAFAMSRLSLNLTAFLS